MTLMFCRSSELIGGLRADKPLKLKALLGCLILGFCMVANSVGPSSAILMIPANQTWPTAQYDFYLNGTNDDLT